MRKVLLFLVIIFFWFLPPAQAEIKTFVHTVRQPFSGSQSPDDARVAATHKAKREVLEKAGTYLETLTIVEKGRLTKDQVLALASGVLKTEIISQKHYTTKEGFGIIIKAGVQVDTSVLEERIKKLMADRTAMEQLTAIRKREKELLDKIESLEEKQVLVKIERLKEKHSGSGKERTTQITEKEIKKDFRETTKGLDAVALVGQTLGLGKSDEYFKTIEILNKAIELDPDDAWAYSHRGFLYGELKQYAKAIQDFDKAIELDPDDAGFYSQRGLAYGYLNQHIKALQEYNRAIELNPDDAGFYSQRGVVYDDLNQYARAIQDYTKAIELDPSFAKIYYNRGIVYRKLGQHQRAIKNFSQAISLNPNYYLSYINRGLIYLGLGQYQQAIEDYNKAIRLDPNNPAAYLCRGVTYGEWQKPDLACKDLEQACNLGDCERLSWAKDGGLCQ